MRDSLRRFICGSCATIHISVCVCVCECLSAGIRFAGGGGGDLDGCWWVLCTVLINWYWIKFKNNRKEYIEMMALLWLLLLLLLMGGFLKLENTFATYSSHSPCSPCSRYKQLVPSSLLLLMCAYVAVYMSGKTESFHLVDSHQPLSSVRVTRNRVHNKIYRQQAEIEVTVQ